MGGKRVGIVGAGLSGLIAAKELLRNDCDVQVFEKLDRPGGRMRTEVVNGWSLDVGFQVLLSAYPHLSKHVDWNKLNIQKLDAAATIFHGKNQTTVGDPFRTKNILFSTIFSDVGSLKDKWLIFKLKLKVQKLSVDEIFELSNNSTADFLNEFGFSKKIINCFFRPFFSGIFLEHELITSSRMFLFVFKMFAEGNAVIPQKGIGELASYLIKTEKIDVRYDADVQKIEKNIIVLKDGQQFEFDFIINTIPNLSSENSKENWNDCHNIYFEHSSPRLIKTPRIGLNANEKALVNNIFYSNSITEMNKTEEKELLSVTIVNDQGMDEVELQNKVKEELKRDFGLRNLVLVKHYYIPIALPRKQTPSNSCVLKLNNGVLNIGDYLLNGSQNAACKIGEEAARYILQQ